MTARGSATRYARALFDVALKEHVDPDLVNQQLAGFTALVSGHETLQRALTNPAVPGMQKRAVVEALLARAGELNPILGKLLLLLAERGVAALGSDGNNDTAPSTTAGVDFPIHVLAINAMGLHLLDYLRFEELAARCVEAGRWSFLCVIAPLRLPSATGSPVNPIAIL